MSKKYVFVIGAGASKEVGLPVGSELREIIAKHLNFKLDQFGSRLQSGDVLVHDALKRHIEQHNTQNNSLSDYIADAQFISEALPLEISIDNFVDKHRDNDKIELISKIAIVRTILEEESKSKLSFDTSNINNTISFSEVENTWYASFFKQITENCTFSELRNRLDNITLIIFNYDRCVPHFLCKALMQSYRIEERQAVELVKTISIYHPYGTVGSLPWKSHDTSIEYGEIPVVNNLLLLAQNIKTFTEGTDPNQSDIDEIKRKVGEADVLVFLGFAFHKQNMELISSDQILANRSIKCYATTLGISDSDKIVILDQIQNLYRFERPAEKDRVKVYMSNVTCHELFSEYSLSLAF